MGQDYRVALIAIASNEGAYLAQFVFHHLRMGFAPIILITNNSEDDTAAMAARMAERLPDVHHLDGDPLREVFPLLDFQWRAYELAIYYIQSNRLQPDYVMDLDVDEYWVPLTDDFSVSEYLNRHRGYDTYIFNWIIPFEDSANFSHSIVGEIKGVTLRPAKTIWRYGVRIKRVNAHNVISNEIKREFVVSGATLFETRGRTVDHPECLGDATVIHQMFRGMTEYVAMLLRGRPTDAMLFKTSTREGYRSSFRNRKLIEVRIPDCVTKNWALEFGEWVNNIGLAEIIIASRLQVVARAERGLALYDSLSEEERAPYANAFRFVDFDAVRAEIAELLADPKGRIARIP